MATQERANELTQEKKSKDTKLKNKKYLTYIVIGLNAKSILMKQIKQIKQIKQMKNERNKNIKKCKDYKELSQVPEPVHPLYLKGNHIKIVQDYIAELQGFECAIVG